MRKGSSPQLNDQLHLENWRDKTCRQEEPGT